MALFEMPKKAEKGKKPAKKVEKVTPKPKAVKKKAVSAPLVREKEDQDIIDLIKRTRLQLLVHSYIYYRLNENVISDYQFDMLSKRLVDLQEANPELSKEVEWAEAFEDWDGSTGFNLPLGDSWVQNKGNYILKLSKENKDGTGKINGNSNVEKVDGDKTGNAGNRTKGSVKKTRGRSLIKSD